MVNPLVEPRSRIYAGRNSGSDSRLAGLAPVLRKRFELRALTREYASLTGRYAHYRIRDDGTHEPTGGTVEIAWQPARRTPRSLRLSRNRKSRSGTAISK